MDGTELAQFVADFFAGLGWFGFLLKTVLSALLGYYLLMLCFALGVFGFVGITLLAARQNIRVTYRK